MWLIVQVNCIQAEQKEYRQPFLLLSTAKLSPETLTVAALHAAVLHMLTGNCHMLKRKFSQAATATALPVQNCSKTLKTKHVYAEKMAKKERIHFRKIHLDT